MKNLHNIEKSGFRKGEYVGYADGAWRITPLSRYRTGRRGWMATKGNASFTRATLEGISQALDVTAKFLADNPGAAACVQRAAPSA